jgi:hypothetical protein
MTLHIANITFDCDQPAKVAAFWAAALDRDVDDGATDYFCSIRLPSGAAATNLLFLKVPEPKTAKNRVHLDLVADDRAAEVARLGALGATHVGDKEEWGLAWSVLHDIEGNELCIAEREAATSTD